MSAGLRNNSVVLFISSKSNFFTVKIGHKAPTKRNKKLHDYWVLAASKFIDKDRQSGCNYVCQYPCKQFAYFNMKNLYSINDNATKYEKGALRSP